ncbi:2-keto-4-pentenoate hydratase [Devosia sp. LC5]|uniref:2-keto-4-pentenoate hydratase n=1 Tax=Devosia sp. LC5 TaxID=1502724 RepID=UPI0004E344EB|nr:fumarylacetoacetate hydrolase family protein [Devosia sp. LC5]KFC71802.1 2-keto-4-pentenoate hydratase [Devosia sp. LC5]
MASELTELLLAARRSGVAVDPLDPALVPASAEAAYAVQNEIVAALGPVGAWKVTPKPADGPCFAAPILKSGVYQSGAVLKTADLPGIGIEVEVAVTIGQDLPGKPGGYGPDDIKAALASIHIAIEVLATRYKDRKAAPQLAGIADLQSSGAVIVGPPVPASSLPEFGQQAMALFYDGTEIKTTAGNADTDNVLAALVWLADHATARGLKLTAGTVVITGARIGPADVSAKLISAEAPGLGRVAFNLV